MSDDELIRKARGHATDDPHGPLLSELADRLEQLSGGRGARMMTSAEVIIRMDVSLRTLWRLVAAGRFPQPVRYSRKLVRWREADVLAHLAGEPGGRP